MEIRHLIKKSLNEALGVPDNLYETSVLLYDKIIPKLKNLDTDSIEDSGSFTLGFQGKFRIADFEFTKVFISFHFKAIEKIEQPDIIAMSIESESQKSDDLKLKMIRKKSLKLNVKILVPEDYNFDDFQKFIQSNKNEFIESLSHELKHSYDAFKKIYDNPHERALYNAVSGKQFGIWPIDRFLHDIYYVTVNESLVRPSEVAAAIRNNDISQKEFLKFLQDSDTYKNLKRISQFNYENFKEEIRKEMKRVDLLLKHLDYKVKKMSEDEKIEEVLRLVMVNVSNWTVEEYKDILTTNFLEGLMGFEGEKERVFERLVNRTRRFKTPEEFFKYYEKLFNYVGEKMIKKVSKLFAITKKG